MKVKIVIEIDESDVPRAVEIVKQVSSLAIIECSAPKEICFTPLKSIPEAGDISEDKIFEKVAGIIYRIANLPKPY